MSKLAIAAAFLVASVAATPALATSYSFNDIVNGAQETPVNASLALATASGTYDDVTNVLTIQIVQTVPSATLVNNAHIHQAPPGVPGGVIIPLPGPFNVSNSYNLAPTNFVLTATQETNFLAGLYYVNIHTVALPGGEIRGQLNPVALPAPALLPLLALGAGLAALRRRS
jgi:hypothetical protein